MGTILCCAIATECLCNKTPLRGGWGTSSIQKEGGCEWEVYIGKEEEAQSLRGVHASH